MPNTRWFWAYDQYPDEGHWTGPFATRELAIAAGTGQVQKENRDLPAPEQFTEVWVAPGRQVTVEDLHDFDWGEHEFQLLAQDLDNHLSNKGMNDDEEGIVSWAEGARESFREWLKGSVRLREWHIVNAKAALAVTIGTQFGEGP